jgi:hypothetical protein
MGQPVHVALNVDGVFHRGYRVCIGQKSVTILAQSVAICSTLSRLSSRSKMHDERERRVTRTSCLQLHCLPLVNSPSRGDFRDLLLPTGYYDDAASCSVAAVVESGPGECARITGDLCILE